MPVTQWFTDNYSFDTAQAQRIIENMDFPNLDALVVMAKKLPLSEEGQRKLLHMVDDAAAYVLTPLNVKVDGDLLSVSIKPGQYPLLYNYRSKAFRQYKNAKRSAVDSKYVKPSNEILTEDELEQYEHVLRQLGWYLSTFEQNYGGWAGTAIQDQAGLTGEDLIHRDIKTGRASLNIGYDALVRAYRDVREKERKRELR